MGKKWLYRKGFKTVAVQAILPSNIKPNSRIPNIRSKKSELRDVKVVIQKKFTGLPFTVAGSVLDQDFAISLQHKKIKPSHLLWIIHQKCMHIHSCHRSSLFFGYDMAVKCWLPDSHDRISLSSSTAGGNYLSNTWPKPRWHEDPAASLQQPGGPAKCLSHFRKHCGMQGSREFCLMSFSTFLSFHQFPGCHMHMKSGALHGSFTPSELTQSSEWEYSLGKKCSRNVLTHFGLQKCFYHRRGQSTIMNIKL